MRKAPVLSLLLVSLLAACAGRVPVREGVAPELDFKLSTHAWMEDGSLVTVIVNTLATRDRDGEAYMPLEVAIANNGLRQLPLTLESFTLVDSEDRRYPAATPRELIEGYDKLDFDRRIAELPSITATRFAANTRYPSNFSPTRIRSRLVRDLVSLPRHGYLIDWLYFPAPATGIRGERFALFVDSPVLEDPVFVKFEVR